MSTVSSAVIIIRARIQIYNIHPTRVLKNSQLVSVSNAHMKVGGVSVGLLHDCWWGWMWRQLDLSSAGLAPSHSCQWLIHGG